MTTWIALLRGINVTGHNPIAMPELRRLCEGLGHRAVQTYIQSGNLVFEAVDGAAAAEVEAALEDAIRERFGLAVPVIVRRGDEWPRYLAGNPFPAAAAADARHLLLALSKAPPREDAVEGLRARAAAGERLELVGDAIWIHYVAGVARSKLSPAVLDRLVGSPVTGRNWRTVQQLAHMVGAAAR